MKYFSLSTLVLVGIFSISTNTSAKNLEDFNHSPTSYGTSDRFSVEPHLLTQFKDKKFVCHGEEDFIPKESTAAEAAFKTLVEYASTGDQVENFWMDANNRKKRSDLLASAVKAGSWKAIYLNSLWIRSYSFNPKEAADTSAELRKLAQQGVPIALYKYASYLYGRDHKTMYELLSVAVDRGSPQAMAMAMAGGNIVMQAKELHPIGKKMLECAVKQGFAPAYSSLGQLAFMEGRRLDAYRLWQQGLNEGCSECGQYLESLATIRPGYTYARSMIELVPEIAEIYKFYNDNFFYKLSELPDVERPLPKKLAFHLDDNELLKLLNSEQR